MTRSCSGCTLCCKLLPVNELDKLAGQRCKHQCFTGCRVYTDPSRMPGSCRLWNCRWIVGTVPRELRRPDRSHYVIDIMPDYIKRVDNETGETIDIPVIVIWCDPDYPEAHRDPALRAWLDAEQICGLVRFNSSRARFIAPPSKNAAGVWFEHESEAELPSHSLQDIIEHTGTTVHVEIVHDSR